MKKLTQVDLKAAPESARGAKPLAELSTADLERVVGAAGCWMQAVGPHGTGWYVHSPYPPAT